MTSKSHRKGAFLAAYKLQDCALQRADRKSGRPALTLGVDEIGNHVLIKSWPRTTGDGQDELRELWQHEIRHLYRLGGYPGASTSIATLLQAGFDDAGFYLVLDLGQREPLTTLLQHRQAGHWLKNPRITRNRLLLWQNLSQIAVALEILHDQGLLHRNVDQWSILASGGSEPDFQLTGFEWSLRLAGAANAPTATRTKTGAPASFVEDWRAFGELAAGLLGADVKRVVDLRIVPSDVADHLSAAEVRLLRQLIRIERLDRLDGEIVRLRIQEILRELGASVAGREAKFHLVFRFAGAFAQRIREASGNDIEVNDTEAMLEFVRADLGDAPLLLAIKNEGLPFRLTLSGTLLTYSLSQYIQKPGMPGTWEMAYCERAEANEAAAVNILGQIPLEARSLEIMDQREAGARFPRLRGKLSSWEQLRKELDAEQAKPDRAKRVHQALALTQFLEALYAAADVYPVDIREVVDAHGAANADGEEISVAMVPRQDPERDALSVALGLRPPAKRFEDVMLGDARIEDWVLTEARQIGDRESSDTSWKFSRKEQLAASQPIYIFVGSDRPATLRDAALVPADFVGRDIQLRRRLRALRALADHSELLRMLDDPRSRILDSHEVAKSDERFAALDESKRTALAAIISTIPLFLVQGPPGVGKTRLVRDLVLDTLTDNSSARLLLTAQSNAAVNHLMDELAEALEGHPREPVIVRSQSKDNKDDAGDFEVVRQTETLMAKLAASPLVADAPQRLQKQLSDLQASAGAGSQEERSNVTQGRQAMESLLVRGANLLFATSNSPELERLLDERGQFDWVMVEEAGKATGGELIAPLLLSYRRLMIGDHKQLAPFGSERIVQLLANPPAVAQALEAGAEFIGRTLRDLATEEVLDEVDTDQSDFPALCSLALGQILLFERMIEDEFKVHKNKPKARRLAQRLTLQHRMHPALADVVSHSFYDNELKTHEEAAARILSAPPPVSSTDSKRLPNGPLIFIDMPWVQATVGMKGGDAECRPRWHSPAEVDTVRRVLSLLKVREGLEKPPTLAVLSPYSEQVRRLKAAIDDDRDNFSVLSNLAPAVDADRYCGTVDSFQGNEADVVIVSLVRNNHHASLRRALGFLSDPRRMNVLLSRAKSCLFVIGSLAFIRSTIASNAGTDALQEAAFLGRFLDVLETQRQHGKAVIIPSERLVGGK
ncbi:AAA domain-containing protein [Methylosinus sp. LW3]|uniref:AAA domain-containing protein n=1 Tax=Methylosinus sp. LW3 TaxID=107635 RepID=UPI000463B7E3|nr:AAA domain-containing protein [Methylosinus sp. LW3]